MLALLALPVGLALEALEALEELEAGLEAGLEAEREAALTPLLEEVVSA